MMAFGAVIAVLSLWRYHTTNRAIERGELRPGRGLVVLMTALVVLLAVAMVYYMLSTAEG